LAELGGEDDVSGEGEVGPGSGGYAVYRDDDWLAQGAKLKHQRVVVFAKDSVEAGSVRVDGLGKVLAAAKGTAFAGEEYCPHVSICSGLAECVLQFQGHVAVKRVKYFGAVKRNANHASVEGNG